MKPCTGPAILALLTLQSPVHAHFHAFGPALNSLPGAALSAFKHLPKVQLYWGNAVDRARRPLAGASSRPMEQRFLDYVAKDRASPIAANLVTFGS